MVSIIIPCHNAERWLGQAIESTLAQTCGDFEVIVVDDASSDGSLAVAESYGTRIRVIRGEWRNGNSARNRGLADAEGQWVQFLDADDALLPGKIADQLKEADQEIDVVYSPLIVREHKSDGSVQDLVSRFTEDADLVEHWLRWELCQTGAALWRTESLRRIGGWKDGLPCCQDNELTLRALQNGLKFQYVDTPGAIYRIWSEETVCRKDPRRVVRQKTRLIDDCLKWLIREGRMCERYRQLAGQACFEMARTLAKYDLSEASAYFSERKSEGLMEVSGPAAPARFRFIERMAGFKNAERVAALLR